MAIQLKDIKGIKDRVEGILFTCREANKSDDLLYWLVCEEIADENGYSISGIKAAEFFIKGRSWGFPGYETVRRSRQKVQEQYPSLKGNALGRVESEKSFRAFAREKDGKG